MTDICLVLVTAPNLDKAAELGRTVVEEGLAACANLVPGLRSIYRWEGKVHDEGEVLMLLKTRDALFDALRERIVSLHPYQCPEVLKLAVDAGHAPYLDWVRGSTRG
ncbi:MAG: divalent-cation tolerance protein CutA [Myxococcaceae bacterium]